MQKVDVSRFSAIERLTIQYLPISGLIPDPKNARRHPRAQINALKRSIGEFGFNVPAIVDKEPKILAGHARVTAALELGLTEIPVIQLEHLSRPQALAFSIADNRISERSEWDERTLAENLKELTELVLDFEIEATGFEVPEIDLRISLLEGSALASKVDPADEFPTESGLPTTRRGDLWIVGDHQVLCGNSLDDQDLARLMAGHKADVVFSDPPYNVPIKGHAGGLGRVQHREFPMASGEMTDAGYEAFLGRVFSQTRIDSRPGSLHYYCIDWRHTPELQAAAVPLFGKPLNLCVWAKSQAGMGSLYRSQHELIFVFRNGDASHRNNVRLGKYGRSRSNLWMYEGANTFRREGDDRLLDLHPTLKPIALVADAILDCTAPGDIVLDTFVGAGTTVLAAERTRRRAFGIELDPIYVDTTIRRWERLTGKSAQHETGRTFAEIAIEREANRD